MDNYKPNSNRYNELKAQQSIEEANSKKLESVVSGNVSMRKKTTLKKVADIFFQKDINDVKSYLIMDVLIPEIRDALYNLVMNGLDMMLYDGKRTRKSSSNTMRVNYSAKYNNQTSIPEISNSSPRTKSGLNFDDVVFDDRMDAEEVLNQMLNIIEQYDSVSVADFCELAGIPGEYTDRKYGWTSLGAAEVKRISGGGYILKLPRVILL